MESDGRNFAAEQRARWPNGFDGSDSGVKRGYGVTGLPETFFIDRDGVIVSHTILGLDAKTFRTELAKITAPSPAGATTTMPAPPPD